MTSITENNVGWRYVQYMKVGDEYSVRTLGDTIGASWNAAGAIIGGQSLPDIGRRFVCLAPASGTGSVEDLQLNLNATLGPISGTVAVSNFPASQPVTGTFFQATQPVSGSVVVSSLPAIAITNTSFDVGNFPATQVVSGTVDVGTLPAIAITNTSFEISNFTPDATTNTFLVAYVITGNWYKVESIGTTSGAQWSSVGAIIGGESLPPVGRVFKALSNAPGTGTVSTIIYSQNVDVSTLPAIAITNTSFDVGNFPATQVVSGTVDVGTLPAIAITNTSFDVGNFPATQVVSGTIDIGNYPASVNVVGTVDIGNYPPLVEVNIASQSVSLYVDIASSVPLDITSLPPIAITNTSFAVTNTNVTALAVKPVNTGFAVTTINTTTAVSRTTIDLTSHQIKASGSGTVTTMTLSSNLLAATLGTINFVKFYNLPTATDADTPILKIGLLSNQSLTIDANISFTNGCCVRASALWADNDVTVPTENITGSFFLRV